MTTHGTARIADWNDLRHAGLATDWKPGSMPDGLLIGWWHSSQYDFGPITYKGDLHQLIVGGIGGGKFTTALAPLLFGSGLDGQTVVAIDPKGEIAKLTGPYFQKPFAEAPAVFVLDPWNECGTGDTASLSFMDLLTEDNPNCVDDARALAEAMIVPSGNENTHWDTAARNFLAALLLHVALDPGEEGKRNLLRVRDLITLPWAMPKGEGLAERETLLRTLVRYMDPPRSERMGGAIRRGFTAMLNREEKERSGIISSLDRETAWIDSPAMKKVLSSPSLDLKKAALGGGKYFVVLPANYLATHRAWLRLCVAAFSTAFKTHKPPADARPQHTRWRHIVIDEFATLGEMKSVVDDIAIARGYDIKYHLAIQELPQLERIYQKGWQSFINNSFQRFFAVNDVMTTGYVSEMLGETTVEARSVSRGRTNSTGNSSGTSTGTNQGSSGPSFILGRAPYSTSSGQTSSYTSTNSYSESKTYSESSNEVQRRLMTPDEVRRLSGSDQLILMRGMHGIQSWRPPYWEIFPSLPGFSLKDVLGTIGRQPENEAERERFLGWRRKDLLFKPTPFPAPPVAAPALPAPEIVVQPRRKLWPFVVGAAAILIAAYFGNALWQGHVERVRQDDQRRAIEAREQAAAEEAARKTREARDDAVKAYAAEVARREPSPARIVDDLQRNLVAAQLPSEDVQPDVQEILKRVHVFRTVADSRIRQSGAGYSGQWERMKKLLNYNDNFSVNVESELKKADTAGKADVRTRILASARPEAERAVPGKIAEVKNQRAAEAKEKLGIASADEAPVRARQLADGAVSAMSMAASNAARTILENALSAHRSEINAAGLAARRARVESLTDEARKNMEQF
jgi:type IV secretion system protein VirD4